MSARTWPGARRWLTIAVTAGLGTALAATTAVGANAAAPYPPSAPTCSATPANPGPDSSVTITGTGFTPGTDVEVSGSGSAIVTHPSAGTDDSGGFSALEGVGHSGAALFTLSGTVAGSGPAQCRVELPVTAPPSGGTPKLTQVGALDHDRVAPGDKTMFSGCGYKPDSTVTVTDTAGDSFGSAPVGADGCFHKMMQVTTPGSYTLVATGQGAAGETLVTTAHLVVAALVLNRGEGSASAGLAYTGADGIGLMLLVGGGLVGAGSGLVAGGRRRGLVRTH